MFKDTKLSAACELRFSVNGQDLVSVVRFEGDKWPGIVLPGGNILTIRCPYIGDGVYDEEHPNVIITGLRHEEEKNTWR